MSTDDSISEDVSTSGALSHCHASADGDGGKESEISCVSSEGTSASCLAGLEDGHTRHPKSSERGEVGSRPMNISPACDKIRSLCLSTEEAFDQGKSLPFINPSSLETLRALVQEIQNSGETDPEMWKDCEGRWLHLFQLVEKQYQEQILAQQGQYQCQIQLIQDEIKALVQLQNRQPHSEFSPTSATNTTITHAVATPTPTKDLKLTLASDPLPAPSAHPPHGRTVSQGPGPAPLPQRSGGGTEAVTPAASFQERPVTVLSSGYGTLSAWETGPHQTSRGPGGGQEEELEEEEVEQEEVEELEDGCRGNQQRGEMEKEEHRWSSSLQGDGAERSAPVCHRGSSNHGRTYSQAKEPGPSSCQQPQHGGTNQHLTSWAKQQKLRPRKDKTGTASSQGQESQEPPESPRESPRDGLSEHIPLQDQYQPGGASTSVFPLRRSNSLMSESSGLTYWRLNECDLYHPLPDSLDSGAFLFLQEDTSATPPPETQLSLKEIYRSKQKAALKCTDWDGSQSSGPLSPQAGGASDPAALTRQSDRTSGFTSPSHFSSPSYQNQTHPPGQRGPGTPATPDSMAGLGNLSGPSSTSSGLQSATPPPNTVQGSWGSPAGPGPPASGGKAPPAFFLTGRQSGHRASEEEEGSHTHTHTSTLKPGSASTESPLGPLGPPGPRADRASPLDDPVVLSLLRQNLREKHARHVADLKAYYESEIQSLRDKLGLAQLPPDLEKSNRALELRCNQLEKALSEANHRIHEVEARNNYLEKKLADWPERYAVAGATVASLQQRLEDSKRWGGEKDALASRLKARVRQLEESLQTAVREKEEKEAQREREYKMLQDLLGEYDMLRKDYDGAKDNLLGTENKLVDSLEQISELNRAISKLESQVKQLEHENQARQRLVSHGNTQPSGAGLYHHPDLLLSSSTAKTESSPSHRRAPAPTADQPTGGCQSPFPQTSQRRSPCPQTSGQRGSPGPQPTQPKSQRRSSRPQTTQTTPPSGQRRSPCPQTPHVAPPNGHRRSPCPQTAQTAQPNQPTIQRSSPSPQNDPPALPGGPAEGPSKGAGWRSLSLPERDLSRPPSRQQPQVHQEPSGGAWDLGRRESQSPLTPVMRALMELEETRATQSRAPWVDNPRSTMGFMERRHKEPVQDWVFGRPEDNLDISKARTGFVHVAERDGSGSGSGATRAGAERAVALLRAQRSLSPEGHRSSSLPPAAHRTAPPPSTPTKRETLLLPRSAMSSPKRCPTENYSTAFSHMLPRQQHLQDRLDGEKDPRRHSFHNSSPRKRLQFSEPNEQDGQGSPGSAHPTAGASQRGWEEAGRPALLEVPGGSSPLQDRVHTLAEAERLFDELTQEKLQIEAALSRLPGSGGRVSLQNRLDEVALEKRLETLNRDLGSIRMTLKRFHVLRSSANN
ncbi:M-phase phosphoprotein 9 [Gadus morhua]|nr:M-phase phosphoprotein 9 [Gadus morhua]